MSTGLPEFEFAVDDIPATDNVQEEQQEQEAPAQEQENIENTEEVVEEQQEVTQSEVTDGQAEPEEESTFTEEEAEHYSNLLTFYKERGLISSDIEEFDGNPEKFAEIIENERLKDKQALEESLVNAVPEFGQSIMEYMLSEGSNLTVDKMREFLDLKEQSVIPDIESEDQAKEYLMSKYKEIHGEKIAERLIETLEDDEALLSTAKSEQEKDKKAYEKAEKSKIEQSKAERAKIQKQREQFFNSLTKEIKSTGWKPELQETVYNDIVNQGLRQKTQTIVQHPKALIKLAHYLSYYDPKSGDIDESAFEKAVGSKAAKTIKNTLESSFGRSGAIGGRSPIGKKKQDKNINYTFAD